MKLGGRGVERLVYKFCGNDGIGFFLLLAKNNKPNPELFYNGVLSFTCEGAWGYFIN